MLVLNNLNFVNLNTSVMETILLSNIYTIIYSSQNHLKIISYELGLERKAVKKVSAMQPSVVFLQL